MAGQKMRIDRLPMEMEVILSSLKMFIYWLVCVSFLLYFLHKLTDIVFA